MPDVGYRLCLLRALKRLTKGLINMSHAQTIIRPIQTMNPTLTSHKKTTSNPFRYISINVDTVVR
jgi:hypothetical protein